MPRIIRTGIQDIMLPVASREKLMQLKQDEAQVIRLSEEYNVAGVHIFTLDQLQGNDCYTASCRNFAPIYGIGEEAATGTANAGLTYNLYLEGKINLNEENVFLQGEAMGRPAWSKTCLSKRGLELHVKIGGTGRISMKGMLMLDG